MRNPFRYFNSSPEVIRLAVMMYIHDPQSLRVSSYCGSKLMPSTKNLFIDSDAFWKGTCHLVDCLAAAMICYS